MTRAHDVTDFDRIQALAFDHYGTLFDKQAVSAVFEDAFPGAGAEAARLWYDKIKEYCFLSGMMDRYQTWEALTRRALTYVGKALSLDMTDALFDSLVEADLKLPPYPEVPAALARLSAKFRLYVLSMGSPHMIVTSQKNAGVDGHFSGVITTEGDGVYKPSALAYDVGVREIGLEKPEIGMVSSNSFDVMGAAHYGYPTFWLNRAGGPLDEIGPRPDLEVADLAALADALGA